MICLLRRRERDERVRLGSGVLDAERSRSGTHHNLSFGPPKSVWRSACGKPSAPVQHTWQVEVEIKLLLEEPSAGPRLHLDQDRAPLCRGARPTDVLVLVERHTALAHGYTRCSATASMPAGTPPPTTSPASPPTSPRTSSAQPLDRQ